ASFWSRCGEGCGLALPCATRRSGIAPFRPCLIPGHRRSKGACMHSQDDSKTETHPAAVSRRSLLQAVGAGGVALALGASAGPLRADDPDAGGQQKSTLRTRLTERHGLRHPVVGAGMGFVALPALVAAVSEAGALGVLGVAP